jgi:hypothetical protein
MSSQETVGRRFFGRAGIRRFRGTLPWGGYIELLDSTHTTALSYSHALGLVSQGRADRMPFE